MAIWSYTKYTCFLVDTPTDLFIDVGYRDKELK